MEQYWMPKELDFEHLRFCLDNYSADRIYIRDCGGYNPDGSYRAQGLGKVNESLEGKSLDFRKDKSGLHMLIEGEEVFHFPLKDHTKGFSLAYERIRLTDDGIGRLVMSSTGVDPDDPELPEPNSSFLRNIFDNHLIEIFFNGRIPLEFHSWQKEPHWKYWMIKK